MEEKIESINLSEIVLPEELIRKIPRQLIEEYQFIPISLKDNILTIALGELPNQAIVNAVEFATTYKIKTVLASKSDIRRCVKELFSEPKPRKPFLLEEFPVVQKDSLKMIPQQSTANKDWSTIGIIVGVSLLGLVIFGLVSWLSNNPQLIVNKTPFKISTVSRIFFCFDTAEPITIDIVVVEEKGRNIEFEVINNDRVVYSSGVHKREAPGKVSLSPGNVSIGIINGNLFDTKEGYITITTPKQKKPLPLAVKETEAGEYYYSRGVLYQEAGDYPKAIESYKQAIRFKPGYADAETRLKSISGETPRTEEKKSDFVGIGEKGILSMEGLSSIWVAVDKESYNAFTKAFYAGDEHGYMELLLLGKVFMVENDTAVLVIDHWGFLDIAYRIRVLEGTHEGKGGWVSYKFVKPKKQK